MGPTVVVACFFGVIFANAARGEPRVAIVPDPPARTAPPTLAPAGLPDSSNLDGLYVWLGPSGAASYIDSQWDSTIGADASVIRVREHDLLGAIGGSIGASRWTVRGGGRIWLDAIVGTPILGWMIGVSAGPIVELSDFAHPRYGGSAGVWGFAGVTPFARVGAVDQLGMFVEVGIHIALPVFRR
jgi:hypothetical protein